MNREIDKNRITALIDLDAIRANIINEKEKIGSGVKMCAVVKTDAYGHGAVPVANALQTLCEYFAVATVSEGLELRENNIKSNILILGYIFPDEINAALNNNLELTVFDYETALEISTAALKLNKKAVIQLKIDTGMGRIGFQPTDESLFEIEKISKLKGIYIKGVFTHFSKADEKDKTFFNIQKDKFLSFISKAEKTGIEFELKHMCNSAAINDFDGDMLDMVRSGIITYGLLPSPEIIKNKIRLSPALSLSSSISFIKKVGKDFPVSYGADFITKKETTIATVPVGYGDGYPRALSNKGYVLINGKKANIIGRICMDQFMIDLSDIKGIKRGDKVVLIGRDNDEEITAELLGKLSGRFNYELCCNINKRVPRYYKLDGQIYPSKYFYNKKENNEL